MPKRRKSITASIKQEVWKKTGGRCHICGKVFVFDAVRGKNV